MILSLSLGRFSIEARTHSRAAVTPDKPTFIWKQMLSTNAFATIKVIWMPSYLGIAGSNFFVKFRIKGKQNWNQTNHSIVSKDFVIVSNLELNETYEFAVVSVDGEFTNISDVQDVSMVNIGMYSS